MFCTNDIIWKRDAPQMELFTAASVAASPHRSRWQPGEAADEVTSRRVKLRPTFTAGQLASVKVVHGWLEDNGRV